MSNNVKLNISKKEKNKRGWHEVTASDDKTKYWYKYNGGGWGGGNGDNKFEVPEKGVNPVKQTFNLTFTGNDDKDYKFVSYHNKSNPTDLSGDVKGDNNVIITNNCEKEGDFSWGVKVAAKDTPTVIFECDPMVRNIFS